MLDISTEDALNEAERVLKGLRDLSQILAMSKIPITEEIFVIYEISFDRILDVLQQIRAREIASIKLTEEKRNEENHYGNHINSTYHLE